MISMGSMPTLLELENKSHVVFRCRRRLNNEPGRDDLFNWYVRQLGDSYQIVKVNFEIDGEPVMPPVIMPGDVDRLYSDSRNKITSLIIMDSDVKVINSDSPNSKVPLARLAAYHDMIVHSRNPKRELEKVAGYGRF